MVWKKRSYDKESFWLTEGDKYIHIYKSMGVWWIDYGLKRNMNRIDSKMVKNKKNLMKEIRRTKRDFVWRTK